MCKSVVGIPKIKLNKKTKMSNPTKKNENLDNQKFQKKLTVAFGQCSTRAVGIFDSGSKSRTDLSHLMEMSRINIASSNPYNRLPDSSLETIYVK